MNKTSDPSREERLAARLRENLHRRKAQARARPAGCGDPAMDGAAMDRAAGEAVPGEGEENGALSKQPPKS